MNFPLKLCCLDGRGSVVPEAAVEEPANGCTRTCRACQQGDVLNRQIVTDHPFPCFQPIVTGEHPHGVDFRPDYHLQEGRQLCSRADYQGCSLASHFTASVCVRACACVRVCVCACVRVALASIQESAGISSKLAASSVVSIERANSSLTGRRVVQGAIWGPIAVKGPDRFESAVVSWHPAVRAQESVAIQFGGLLHDVHHLVQHACW